MHFELSFRKPVTVDSSQAYINECCWGGDMIRDQLLPLISSKYERIRTGQEDWGWFIWFRRNQYQLAVDIFCDHPSTFDFRLRLYSTIRKFFLFHTEVDSPELRELRDLVVEHLHEWGCETKVQQFP
jgi:hypothetical protein